MIAFLRWVAVIPAAVAVFLIMNFLVLVGWRMFAEDSIFGFIPIVYVVELVRAALAPYASVRAAAYVAPKGKVGTAAFIAFLFVALGVLWALGLAMLAQGDTYTDLPIWFSWVLLPVTLASACFGVYSEYEEHVGEIRATARADATRALQPDYPRGASSAANPDGDDEDAYLN